MIVNINDDKKHYLKNAFSQQLFKILWSSLASTKVNKCSQTSTAAVDPRNLKVEVAEPNFHNCFYVINRACYCPMLIT